MCVCVCVCQDDYFVKRKLYPNVDFYSGLIYKAMGFPTDFFPILFTIPRIAGWLAHWSVSPASRTHYQCTHTNADRQMDVCLICVVWCD